MITEEKHAYRMLFFRQNGITPIAAASEFQFSEGIAGVIRMRRAALRGSMAGWDGGQPATTRR
jgi:hypothetical protein